ncbi:MAG TPA: hypothetical protein PK156_33235 [Polyangium sp.]|nr:hypothetical protein [Polyangium sp.]
MNARMVGWALGIVAGLAWGCGGAEVAPSAPMPAAEATGAPVPDEPKGNDSATAAKPAAETPPPTVATNPTTAQTNAPPPSSDKPVPSDKPADKSATSDVPGANISIGRLEADGLVTKNIECKSESTGLGLLGAVLVTAWMSPQKKALDACAPGGKETETRVVWKARGGKLLEIEAKGDAKVKACVEKALRAGKPTFDGHCAASVVYGKP